MPTPRTRPPLNMGPMTGPPEYVKERSENLIRTFEALLDTKIELVDKPGGQTDCYSVIEAPITTPEGLLVVEHELSHWLFESDIFLAQSFVTTMVSKLLNRAGMRPGSDEALPYESHLKEIVFTLANLLEDHRVAGLWGELYPGGEELLRQRWHDHHEYDVPQEAGEQNMLAYFIMTSNGVDVPAAPPDFVACQPALQRARNLVEGVDAAACLGITARMIDEIMDELLARHPPPQSQKGKPPPPKNSGGKSRQGRSRKRKEDRTATAKHGIELLAGTVPARGKHARAKPCGGEMGSQSVKEPASAKGKRKLGRQGQMTVVRRLMKSDDTSVDESGRTPLQLILQQGAEAMSCRLEDARRAMERNQDGSEEGAAQIMLGWTRASGILRMEVTPSASLPGPTNAGYDARRVLEKFRMAKRRKTAYEGDLDVGGLLNAVGAGDMGAPFYIKKTRVAKFELLFLFDFSGSMFHGQALRLVERAVADATYATQAIKSKAHMWGYSDGLYVFTEPGSLFNVPGMSSGSTMMVQALDVARLWVKKDIKRRAIVHTTDGLPTSCRAHHSTGDSLQDLRNVLDEMRGEKIPISTITIRHSMMTVAQATAMYDKAFGEGQYGMVTSMDDVHPALLKAVNILAQAHITSSSRRS